jgi:hypothetical protein
MPAKLQSAVQRSVAVYHWPSLGVRAFPCAILTASLMGQISPLETSALMQALATQAHGTGPARSVHLLVRRAMRWKGSDGAKRFMILDQPIHSV